MIKQNNSLKIKKINKIQKDYFLRLWIGLVATPLIKYKQAIRKIKNKAIKIMKYKLTEIWVLNRKIKAKKIKIKLKMLYPQHDSIYLK